MWKNWLSAVIRRVAFSNQTLGDILGNCIRRKGGSQESFKSTLFCTIKGGKDFGNDLCLWCSRAKTKRSVNEWERERESLDCKFSWLSCWLFTNKLKRTSLMVPFVIFRTMMMTTTILWFVSFSFLVLLLSFGHLYHLYLVFWDSRL